MATFDSDDEIFSAAQEEASPRPHKTLKRLRKGVKSADHFTKSNAETCLTVKHDVKITAPTKRVKKPRAKNVSISRVSAGKTTSSDNKESQNEILGKRKSAEDILKSFGKDLERVDKQNSGGDSLKKRKTVQKSLLGMVTAKSKGVDDALTINEMVEEVSNIPFLAESLISQVDKDLSTSLEAEEKQVLGLLQESETAQDFRKIDFVGNDVCIDDEKEDNKNKDGHSENGEGKSDETSFRNEACNIDRKEEHKDEESEEGSEDEVDEDDEEAVLNLLEREQKIAMDATTGDFFEEKISCRDGNNLSEQAIKKKVKKNEIEEIHAESQRLLRETRRVTFQVRQTAGKSISSVLEKIRWRKVQLAQGLETRLSANMGGASKASLSGDVKRLLDSNNDPVTVDDEINVLIETDVLIEQETKKSTKTREASPRCGEMVDRTVEEDQEIGHQEMQGNQRETSSVPTTPEHLAEPCTSDSMFKHNLFGHGSAFRAPLEDTQDLFSQSQLSHEGNLEESPIETIQEVFLGSSLQGNLRLDTLTQDEDSENWDNYDSNKENVDPRHDGIGTLARTVPHIRALVDDEAEDEDDEDALAFDDEDGQDEGEDLKDLVTNTEEEKAGEADRRVELHRKWLEQQDAAITDDLLLKLKTGWVPRESRTHGLGFLDEEEDGERIGIKHADDAQPEIVTDDLFDNVDDNSQDSQVSRPDEVELDAENAVFKGSLEMDGLHESDDEEADQKILRQRFLEESEEQEEFLSPADDETSREVFGLINKVNAVSNKKKSALGSVETRGLGSSSSSSSNWSSKSFLRKTASLSIPRQGPSSSVSRSFIFGRDDSNSSHSLSNGEKYVEMVPDDKENGQLQGSEKKRDRFGSNSGRSSLAKSIRGSPAGPSLFEILKRQAVDLDQALQSKNANTMPSNQFTAFKPLRSNRASRGT